MKARRGRAWHRRDTRFRRVAAEMRRLLAASLDAGRAADEWDDVARQPGASDDLREWATFRARAQRAIAARADARYWSLCDVFTRDRWARARHVMRADGGGELYTGRVRDMDDAPGRPPGLPWHYVSERRYRELDFSTVGGGGYAGLTPEDRGFRLRFPTKRQRRLNVWRRSVGLPVQPLRPERPASPRGRIVVGRDARLYVPDSAGDLTVEIALDASGFRNAVEHIAREAARLAVGDPNVKQGPWEQAPPFHAQSRSFSLGIVDDPPLAQ